MLYKFQSKRLHKLFEQAFYQLPIDVRQNVVERCDMVTDMVSEASKRHLDTDAVAITNGHTLYLDSDVLDQAPPDYVTAVVAHEIGHIFLGHTRPDAKGLFISDTDADRQVDTWVGKFGFRRLVKEQQVMSTTVYSSLKTFGGGLVK